MVVGAVILRCNDKVTVVYARLLDPVVDTDRSDSARLQKTMQRTIRSPKSPWIFAAKLAQAVRNCISCLWKHLRDAFDNIRGEWLGPKMNNRNAAMESSLLGCEFIVFSLSVWRRAAR
jgi:hypothetical protein